MTTYIEELVARLGFEIDGSDLDKFEKKTDSLKNTLKKVAQAASIVAGALTGVIAVTNKETTEIDSMAKSVGVTTENLLALSNAIKPLGFGLDNVVDMIEELNNKMGESTGLAEQMTAVKDATHILGLEFKDLKDLKPEEQFFTILDAAVQLEDTQKAVSAVDMLTGGEGNKIIGFLRQQGASMREIVEEQKRLNFLTQEGIDGAAEMSSAMGQLGTIGKSIFRLFSGEVGKVLAPLIRDGVEWLKVNKELVQGKLREWALDIGKFLTIIYKITKRIILIFKELIESVGGVTAVFNGLLLVLTALVASQFIAWAISLVAIIKKATLAVGGLSGALGILKVAALGLKWVLIFGLLLLIIEDIYGFFTGKDSFIGDMSKEFEQLIEDANEFWADLLDVSPDEFRVMVVGFVTHWYDAFTDMLMGWGESLSTMLVKATTYFNELYELAVHWWGEVFDEAMVIASNFWDSLVVLFDNGVSELKDILITLGEEIAAIFYGIRDGITEALDDAVGSVRQQVNALTDILPDSIKSYVGLETPEAPAVKGSITGQYKKAFTGISAGVSSFASGISAGFQKTSNTNKTNNSSTFNINVPTNLAVTQKGEMSPEELTREVSKAIGTEVSKAVRNNSEGVQY